MVHWLRKLSPEELHAKDESNSSLAGKLANFVVVLQLDGFTYDCRALRVLLKVSAMWKRT